MSIAPETSWDESNELLDDSFCERLTLEYCNIDYWFENVAQGAALGLVNGHRADRTTPAHMREPGPLRAAMLEECAYRARSEEIATRGLSNLIFCAPGAADAEFFATLVLDEARHARVFRAHLTELGIEPDGVDAFINDTVRDSAAAIAPLEHWALGIAREKMDYYGGVAATTIIIEGALAPASVLSERKWQRLDPAGADIGRGAAMDEIRHLCVGANIVRRHVRDNPGERTRLTKLLEEGAAIWRGLERDARLLQRERMFQNGMGDREHLLAGQELAPGLPLLGSTPEQRLELAERWSDELRRRRLAYMGLEAADRAWS